MFGVALCIHQSIANYCPQMCEQIICKCGFDSCLNDGKFIASNCSCACQAQYTGTRCENLITTTKTLLSLKQRCNFGLECLNGGKLNLKTCTCECNLQIN